MDKKYARFVKDPEKMDASDLESAVARGEAFIESPPKSIPADLFDKFVTLWQMISDYWNGRYRAVPWSTIAAVIFAVLYVIIPTDLIPDLIPVLGWMDDAAVVAIVMAGIENDLAKYLKWKAENS